MKSVDALLVGAIAQSLEVNIQDLIDEYGEVFFDIDFKYHNSLIGNKIGTIRALRSVKEGWGLREGKDLVDRVCSNRIYRVGLFENISACLTREIEETFRQCGALDCLDITRI